MTNVRVITPGHKYHLLNHEDPFSSEPQELRFINKEATGDADKLRTVYNGTTNEAVLEMMIHRLTVLNNKLPSDETKEAISHLEEAMSALESRTARRKEAGVEGTHRPAEEQYDDSSAIPDEMPWDAYLKKNDLETIGDVRAAAQEGRLAEMKWMSESRAEDVVIWLNENE